MFDVSMFKNNRNDEIKRPLKGLRAWKKITDNFALFTILLTLLREVGGGGMGLAITQWPRASPDLKPPLVIVQEFAEQFKKAAYYHFPLLSRIK